MEPQELRLMLKDLESDLIERKASLSDPDRIRQAICAFANDLPDHRRPGIIFIGANDDGSCAGLHVTDDLLLKLSQMRDDGKIQPIPSITVEKIMIEGCEMAVGNSKAVPCPAHTLERRYVDKSRPSPSHCYSRRRKNPCRAAAFQRSAI